MKRTLGWVPDVPLPLWEGTFVSDDGAGPTARALLALEVIQSSPGITAARLGERLGVSERAARRYVGILREAHIPVESVRGPYGGFRVGRGVRLPPLTFSSREALGLVMATLDGHHRAGDPEDPVGSALGKILRALPEPVAAQAESVRRATAPAQDRGAVRPDSATAATLVDASVSGHRVRLDYRTEAGTVLDVEADPWAVVVRYGRWYLLCFSHAAQARRVFRVDRVRGVEVLAAAFRAPHDLDPVAALEEHLADGWEFEVDVL
ncbi:MAG: WYL domain-containing protein, partial [Actinomycetales bacterium]|nr:WYL domain-containing protein [Actinomycetales bacterium]